MVLVTTASAVQWHPDRQLSYKRRRVDRNAPYMHTPGCMAGFFGTKPKTRSSKYIADGASASQRAGFGVGNRSYHARPSACPVSMASSKYRSDIILTTIHALYCCEWRRPL